MIHLPDVTLIAMTGIDYKTYSHAKALEESCLGIKFGAVKLIQLGQITDIDSWNKAIIYELPKYVETSHCLLVHDDGFVINPQLWNDEWLKLDFIGAPFPLPNDDFSYRDDEGEIQRVGNSVSLRSKKLMDRVAKFEWKPFYGFTNEDGFFSVHHRKELEREGYKWATLEQAVHFSKEHTIPENDGLQTFCFHAI